MQHYIHDTFDKKQLRGKRVGSMTKWLLEETAATFRDLIKKSVLACYLLALQGTFSLSPWYFLFSCLPGSMIWREQKGHWISILRFWKVLEMWKKLRGTFFVVHLNSFLVRECSVFLAGLRQIWQLAIRNFGVQKSVLVVRLWRRFLEGKNKVQTFSSNSFSSLFSRHLRFFRD